MGFQGSCTICIIWVSRHPIFPQHCLELELEAHLAKSAISMKHSFYDLRCFFLRSALPIMIPSAPTCRWIISACRRTHKGLRNPAANHSIRSVEMMRANKKNLIKISGSLMTGFGILGLHGFLSAAIPLRHISPPKHKTLIFYWPRDKVEDLKCPKKKKQQMRRTQHWRKVQGERANVLIIIHPENVS